MGSGKIKILRIELDAEWILKHRNDDELPAERLVKVISVEPDYVPKKVEIDEIVVFLEDNKKALEKLKLILKRFIERNYKGEDVNKVLKLSLIDKEEFMKEETFEDDEEQDDEEQDDEEQDDEEEASASEDEDEENDDWKKTIGIDDVLGYIDEEFAKKPKKQEKVDAFKAINELAGAAEFKALVTELDSVAEEIKRTKAFEVITSRCYLFSIGEGCGLSTYLNLFAQFIEQRELTGSPICTVFEMELGEQREGERAFSEVCRHLEHGSSGRVKLLCIDISDWIDSTNNRYFREMLREIGKHSDEFIIIFKVPFVDKDVLGRVRYSLSDLLTVTAISFPPFTKEELRIYAEKELSRFNFAVDKGAWEYFDRRISEEKGDGKFYGINTVKKVVRELVYQKYISNSRREEKSDEMTVSDMRALCADADDGKLSGMEQLNALVGVEAIKKRVEEILAQIELSLTEKNVLRPCVHMRFVGNPGTGKTTVARIIGKILKERGVLTVGSFFECSGRDLCGRYVGETAPKTASICRDAYGSVLFIDEAYALYRGEVDSRDFGREAIDTLIAEMENHRSDFVVIMAGYTDDMEKLMGGNAGLASRMPYTIEFPNFTREQLYDVFASMVKGSFKYDEGVLDAAREFFLGLPEDVISAKEFANARYVRNLFERTWAKAAMRCQLNGEDSVLLTCKDFELASADKEFITKLPKKARIGFNN